MFGRRNNRHKQQMESGHIGRSSLFTLLLCAVLAAHAGIVPSVRAQDSAPAAIKNFDISPQPLSSALLQFSETTNLELLFDATMTQDVQTKGVSGDYNQEDALRLLLSETGLTYRVTSAGSITLGKLRSYRFHRRRLRKIGNLSCRHRTRTVVRPPEQSR